MRISVSITNYSWPGGVAAPLAALARSAEDAGVDTLWVADHLIQADPASDVHEPMLEAYATLAYLAAHTERVRLGTMVTAATFRAPAMLIKQVGTIDALSGGRAWLGIGAGYNQDEGRAMGVPIPPTADRYDVLVDTVELAQRMWSGDESPFTGRRTHLEQPIGRPLPLRRPPLLIGGTGEKRTLRLVAEYADACNLFDIPDGGAAVQRQLDVLGRHCADVGRPYEDIERTITTALAPGEPAEQFVARCGNLAALGLQHVVVITRGAPWTDADIAKIGVAVEQLRDI